MSTGSLSFQAPILTGFEFAKLLFDPCGALCILVILVRTVLLLLMQLLPWLPPQIDCRVRRVAAQMIQRCLSKAWANALGVSKGCAAGVLEVTQAKVGNKETLLMRARIEKDSYVKELMMKWYA